MKKIIILFLILICSNANSSEIVKEVYFDTKYKLNNCGVADVRYVFYSDSKFELIWSCPEKTEPDVYTGTWKNTSTKAVPNSLSTTYVHGGVEYKDSIRIVEYNDRKEIHISWNGSSPNIYRVKEKTNENSKTVKKKSNKDPKDLSGNAIDCYAKNTYERRTISATYPKGYKINTHYYATIKFFTKTKVKLAIAIVSDEKTERTTDTVLSEKEFQILLPEGTFTYEVREEAIVIKVTKNAKNLYDPFKYWKRLIDKEGEEIKIWRKTLDIFDPVITGRAIQAGNRMKCKLVDYDDASLFKKYSELNKILNKLLQKQKKESESKNIL